MSADIKNKNNLRTVKKIHSVILSLFNLRRYYSTVALVPPMSTMDVWHGIT